MTAKKQQCETAWDQLTAIVGNIVGVPEGGLERHTSFEDLGADSLDVAEITIDAEQEFSILIQDDEAAKWKNLGDAMEWLEKNADLSRWSDKCPK